MLVLAATPIGNLGDASARLREALENAQTIAAEDTRVTQKLLAGLGIANRPRLVSLHEHNERARLAELVALAMHEDLLLLSDAGMPTVSDPGFALVAAAHEAGVTVTALPGPSAVLTALAVSGLPTDRFCFDGFLPRKAGDRDRTLAALAGEERTIVLFESPHRVAESLAAAARILGDRRAALCRELTKRYEEVRRGTLAELAAWAAEGLRGEICLVIAGAAPRDVPFEAAVTQVRTMVSAGARLKDAAAEVAAATGHRSRALYQAALAEQ